jgi:hypothetical protein
MARVTLVTNEQAPPKVREMFEKIEANGFRVPRKPASMRMYLWAIRNESQKSPLAPL